MSSSPSFAFRLFLLGLIGPVVASAQTSLSVNANQTVRIVDERVFGVNSVMWDSYTSTPQTIAMVQAAGIRAIRIPGGSNSDTYHWRLNKGEGQTAVGVLNNWTWMTGLNGFINLITSVNAQPMVTVNYGSGTPEEAAGLVAYLNASVGSTAAIGGTDGTGFGMQDSGYWAGIRAASPLGADDGMNFLRIGRSAPIGAKYFEIGNECYGSWEYDLQAGAAAHDPTTYANRAAQYMAKMRAVDSTIKIGVVVVTGGNNTGENANYKNWTPVMLARLKVLNAIPDFIIYHLYPQAPFQESDAGLLQVSDSGSKSWTTIAADLRNQLNSYLTTQAAGVEIVVTENNNVYSEPGKQSTSLVNGLYLADSIANLMQTEINGYMWWALRNSPPTKTTNNVRTLDGSMSSSLYGWRQFGDYGMLSSPIPSPTPPTTDSPSPLTPETTYYNAYPTYYTMKLLSHFARQGDTVVQSSSPNSLLSIFSVRRADGKLCLLVINKDPTNALNASIALTGYSPGSTATTYSYGKPQDDAAKPGGSGLTDIASGTMSIGGSTFSASFASYSATVIELTPVVAPSFVTQPASQVAIAGDPVTFTTAASGTPAPSLQWQTIPVGGGSWISLSDSGAYSGSTTPTLTVSSVTGGMSGDQFRCVATNSGGSATSGAATLAVIVPPGNAVVTITIE